MVLVMHSYGFLSVSSQEDEAHIKMSTRKDLFHFLNEASFVRCGPVTAGATQDEMVFVFSPGASVSGKSKDQGGKLLSCAAVYFSSWVLFT